jgi:hypothetical protein
MRYGIDKNTIDKKFLTLLSREGCLPAYCLKEFQAGNNFQENSRLKKELDRMDEYDKKLFLSLNDQQKFKLLDNLLNIEDEIEELPITALMNKLNSNLLNLKIYEIRKEKLKIRDIQSNLRYKNLKFNFENKDYKSLRRSLIWLNWFYFRPNLKTRPRNSSLCLSNDAMKEFAILGVPFLLNNATFKKKELKEKLIELKIAGKERELRGFLSGASLALANLLKRKKITKANLLNIHRALGYFYDTFKDRKQLKLSSSFLFHPRFDAMKPLRELEKIGYLRISHLNCLKRDCGEFIDYDLMYLLYKNFNDFSS